MAGGEVGEAGLRAPGLPAAGAGQVTGQLPQQDVYGLQGAGRMLGDQRGQVGDPLPAGFQLMAAAQEQVAEKAAQDQEANGQDQWGQEAGGAKRGGQGSHPGMR